MVGELQVSDLKNEYVFVSELLNLVLHSIMYKSCIYYNSARSFIGLLLDLPRNAV